MAVRRRRFAFRSGFGELYAVSFRKARKRGGDPRVSFGVLHRAHGYYYDGPARVRRLAVRGPSRQRNQYPGKRSLRCRRFSVFEFGRVGRLDALRYDRRLRS